MPTSQNVTVKEVATFTFTGITANESGEIIFNIETTGKHTPSFNYAVIIPEPATATLSLLALAGLAARRRRK